MFGREVLYAGTFSANKSKYIEFVSNTFLWNGGATVQTTMSNNFEYDRNEMRDISCNWMPVVACC